MITFSLHKPLLRDGANLKNKTTARKLPFTSYTPLLKSQDSLELRFGNLSAYSAKTGQRLLKPLDAYHLNDLTEDEQRLVLSVKQRMVDNTPANRKPVIAELETDEQRAVLINIALADTQEFRLPYIATDIMAFLEDDLLKAHFIIKGMNSEVQSVPQNAAWAIRYIEDVAIKEHVIYEGLKNKNALVQKHASEGLTSVLDQKSLSRLIETGLFHENMRVRENTVKLVTRIENDSVRKKLIRLGLKQRFNANDFSSLLSSLGQFDDNALADTSFLMTGLTHKSHSVRSTFVTLLDFRMKDPEFDRLKTKLIHSLLSPENSPEQHNAGKVIETIRNKNLRLTLAMQYKDHSSLDVKLSVLDIVKESGNPQLIYDAVMNVFNVGLAHQKTAVVAMRRIDDDELKSKCIEAVLATDNDSLRKLVSTSINSLKDNTLKRTFIQELLTYNVLMFKDHVISAIKSVEDESYRATLISECFSGYDNAIELAAAYLIKELENDQIKIDLIKETMIHQNENVSVVGIEALASVKSDDLKHALIEACLNDPYPDYLKRVAIKTIASLKSDDLKVDYIKQYLAQPEVNQSHLYMARAIVSLSDDETKSDMLELAFATLDTPDLREAFKAIEFFENESIKSDWMVRALEHDDSVIHNIGINVLRQKRSPALDPIKVEWIMKRWALHKDFNFSLITSLQDETLKSRWIHLGLLSQNPNVRKNAVLLVQELKDTSLKQQWQTVLVDSYGVEASEL